MSSTLLQWSTPAAAEIAALTELDDSVIEALEHEHIRLVRIAWLMAQPDDYRIERRQDLEAREVKGESPSPLLSGVEAVTLVRRGKRSGGVLSHGWLSPGDPCAHAFRTRPRPLARLFLSCHVCHIVPCSDPAGERMLVIRRAFKAQRELHHIEGLFFECAHSIQSSPLNLSALS